MKLIQLTSGAFTQVDDSDYAELAKFSWSQSGSKGYAYRVTRNAAGKRVGVYMHRVILGVLGGFQVDHRDSNPLNNTRKNLRITDAFGNARNHLKHKFKPTNPYKGVFAVRPLNRRWAAQIIVSRKRISLGSFSTPEAAAREYDRAALEHFGEFAALNFTTEQGQAA